MTTHAESAYRRPASLQAALTMLAQGPCTILAGGTDLYAGLGGREPAAPVLDLDALEPLHERGPVDLDGRAGLRLGALTRWAALADGALPSWARALELAAREVGGRQVQNRGTLGGNLCNASPAADGVPALLALRARVELTCAREVRTLPLEDFVLGPRRTARRADELLTAVLLPVPQGRSLSGFHKLGHRRYLVISIAMIGLAIDLAADGRIAAARVAVGACGPVACRLPVLESRLAGLPAPLDPMALGRAIDAAALAPLTPIDDVRGTSAYRRDAVAGLLTRALADLSHEVLA